ncbi:response regulator transcription factor [Streptomyces sp. NPDC004610]|uniref:response regulator transcription factor n=1 Tax=unclassified Streptomyces TaxID=2593676 RepID=UPI0033A59450
MRGVEGEGASPELARASRRVRGVEREDTPPDPARAPRRVRDVEREDTPPDPAGTPHQVLAARGDDTPPDPARTPHRVLVAEGDDTLRALLESVLRLTGYTVTGTGSGRSALRDIERTSPDAVLLDAALPGLDGLQVTRALRANGDDTPVLLLTGAPGDGPAGARAGADDHLPKPFGVEDLFPRLRTLLGRTAPPAQLAADDGTVLLFADLRLDKAAHEVHRAGEYVPLSPTEFNLLACLMADAGRVVRRRRIVEQVWHPDFAGDTRIIETYVKYLRRKIDHRFDLPLIHTVRGVGYCLRLPRGTSPSGAGAAPSGG